MIEYMAAKDDGQDGQSTGSINCVVALDRGSLMIIANDHPGLHGFECIAILVDLGAPESVLPTFQCMDVPIKGIQESRSGFKYKVEGGDAILNEGGRDVIFMTQEGGLCNMSLQGAEVNKGLGSVADLANQGHKVTFEQKGSYIESRAGENVWLRRYGGMWYQDCWKIPGEYNQDPSRFPERC